MTWKHQRKIHIGNEVWYYAITKTGISRCRDVVIKSPDGKVYRYNARNEAITPSIVKEYIEGAILGKSEIHSKGKKI